MQGKNPICVALDTADLGRAEAMARSLASHVGMVKLGMEFFYAHGVGGYERIAAAGLPIFLDLKLHDIPNTVSSALKALMRLSPRPAVVNIHATGGSGMMQAALDAVAGQSKLIAVTILTSMSDADVSAAGFAHGTQALALKLAELAKGQGLDGVVCSPLDVSGIRRTCGADFLTVVPGIRPASAEIGDQKRIATPAAAIKAGTDILVIGRPITGADDPAAAAQAILKDIAHG